MKKSLFILAGLFLLNVSAFCQNTVNLVIFSEDGDPFYAFINGVKQNNTPETNVKFTNLSPNISLRIEFENKALPQLKQTMALEEGFEHTARIKRDMKKQLKLRYFGRVPLNESASGISTVEYHTADNAYTSSGNTTYTSPNTVNSTTVTQANSANSNPGNVSININMPGVNMNVNATDPDATMNTSTSTTVTSSSSNSSYSSTDNNNTNYNNTTTSNSANNNACYAAMSQASFAKMKESIESKPFSDTKMSTAKVATKNACLSVSQIKEIAKLFSMDDDKLTYSKYAYDHCVDKANYYQVSDVFSFSATTDELNEFLAK